VTESQGRLRTQQQLLGTIFGLMFPTLFGCVTAYELARTRGWDKNLPSRLLGAWPKRSWLKRLRKLGHDVLGRLWRHLASRSDATRSRWQWTWVLDDSVLRKYSDKLELVGTWWSGQHKRVVDGIDGVLLLVVIGDGKLLVPVDFAGRRPPPPGRGGGVGPNWSGRRSCSMSAWRPCVDGASSCRPPWWWPIVGSVTRN
jgi:hypothetical protein